MITEKQLVELGFQKEFVPMVESGMDYDFYYYHYGVGMLDFLSSEDDVARESNGHWTVQILEGGINFTDFEDLKKVINTLEVYVV